MFATPDYVVCFFMLGGSAFIGIYFGYLKKQEKTIDGYLLGSKKMKIVPVAISLMATHLSGLTLLALPSDVYLYGSHYAFVPLVIGIVSIVNCYLFLPVILKLNVPNGFEYLNMRFNRQIRLLSSLIFVVQIMVFNPLVAYIPAIAFSQVSGVNARLITPVVCGICVFYTTIGGFKAVVWTDVFQFAGMVGSVSAIMWLGIKSVGGLQHIWQDALKGGRLDFNFSFDPTVREGFWPIILGGGILWLNIICFHPSTVQKYLSVANPWDVKKVILLASFGIGFVKLCCIVIGIMLFSKYKGCDPLTTGQVVTNDQLLAHFIMNLDGTIPGLGGLFLAGVFSAASSTLSSSFNTLAATIYGDFIIPYVNFNISHNATNFILKTIVVVSGIISIALTFVVEKLGSLLGFSNAALSCVSGLLAGLFLLGMLFPMANSKGALWGTIISATVSVWITSVHQWYKVKGAFDHFIKPLSIEECDFSINFTRARPTVSASQPFILYRLSFWYNSLIATFILIVVGLIVSWCTKDEDEFVDPELISPISQFLITRKRLKKVNTNECTAIGAHVSVTYKCNNNDF